MNCFYIRPVLVPETENDEIAREIHRQGGGLYTCKFVIRKRSGIELLLQCATRPLVTDKYMSTRSFESK